MMINITRLESFVLVACCHCRMGEIDKSVSKLFADMSEKQPDPIVTSAIVALDGERFLVERLLNRLWDHSKGPNID